MMHMSTRGTSLVNINFDVYYYHYWHFIHFQSPGCQQVKKRKDCNRNSSLLPQSKGIKKENNYEKLRTLSNSYKKTRVNNPSRF